MPAYTLLPFIPSPLLSLPPQCLTIGRAGSYAIAAVGAVVTLWASLAAWVQIKRASLLTGSLALASTFFCPPVYAQTPHTLG